MTDYKATLNLPQTSFAMKANLAQREPGMLKQWQQSKLYEQIREARKGRGQFILHDIVNVVETLAPGMFFSLTGKCFPGETTMVGW